MTSQEFMDSLFEIAFGEEAASRDFSKEEVLARLREMSEDAWKYEELLL